MPRPELQELSDLALKHLSEAVRHGRITLSEEDGTPKIIQLAPSEIVTICRYLASAAVKAPRPVEVPEDFLLKETK